MNKAEVARTEYGPRDHMELDKLGNYYSRHVQAMTAEGLHDKSDIAAELASRDATIDRLKKEIHQVRNDAQGAYNAAYKTFLPIIEAAKFYSEKENYEPQPLHPMHPNSWKCPVEIDQGEMARNAFDKMKGE